MSRLIRDLFNKYLHNQCTAEEVEMLMKYFHTDQQEQLNQLIMDELELPDQESTDGEYDALLNRVYDRIHLKINKDKPVKRLLWLRIAVAAAILILLSIGSWFIFHSGKTVQQFAGKSRSYDVLPGGNRAILTLANGKQVVLTGAHQGKLATEGNTNISKTADGEIAYATNKVLVSEQVAYNTITIPSGGQYKLILSDGTRVILNALSSIRYPTRFSGTQRKVELNGEAYFEVAHDKTMPFHVSTKGQDVEVLGTHFNINSYDNEPGIKTTLLEGSVLVTQQSNGIKRKLVPGEQSSLEDNDLKVKTVNTDLATAWKDGYFLFKQADLKFVMRQISRWYDVDVYYDGIIPKRAFTGEIHRNINLSQALQILTYAQVHFKIEGKKIIVTGK